MARFGRFIERAERGITDGLLARPVMLGEEAAAVGAMAVVLWRCLATTLRRLSALHARFAAGKLATAPRLAAAPRRRPAVASAADGATAGRPRPARVPSLPPGPVLLTVFRVTLAGHLRALLEDPEMRALLAAGPAAGRLLRPLWRKLSPEALPEILRLPPRPPRPRQPRAPKPPRPARPAAGNGPPRLRRVTLSDGTRSWEPIPCYPFGEKPPRRRRSRAVDPWELEPAPPPPARPRPAPDPPPRPNPERRLSDYNWIGRLFMR
jgi:hypothetical protein